MITLEHIRQAEVRIADHVRRTPVVRIQSIDEQLCASLYFKCENQQHAGAFKSRGACNAVFSLADEAATRGVATHSSGNHAAALARAAQRRGIPAYIVMPRTARPRKIEAVRRFGGQITFCEPTLADREATAEQVVQRTGATLIHPYDDDRIIAGQATATVELLHEVPDLEIVVTPVGGGGLLSGAALAVEFLQPQVQVWAAEPTGADDAYRSFQSGTLVPSVNPRTIADGLLTSLGRRNFAIIRQHVQRILLADDDTIIRAVRQLWQDPSTHAEPSGAVPLAVLMAQPDLARDRRIGVIVSGGNFDLRDLPPIDPD